MKKPSDTDLTRSGQEPLTMDLIKQVFPTKIHGNLTQDILDNLNQAISNSDAQEYLRENILSYASVLKEGRFKLDQYIPAVKYVSYKLLGDTNLTAYTKTFPDRYQRQLDSGNDRKHISAVVAAYNKNKLVNLIMEQTLVPCHILNQNLYQKALNVQAHLMMHAKSEKVRMDAANSILNQLKRPTMKKLELNVGLREDDSIHELRQATLELVAQQKDMIRAGAMTASDIAGSKL